MVWYSHLFQNSLQFIVIHTVKGFGIVNKAEIDVFLKLSCFADDPADVGSLISGSSPFSKTSLNIWKFTVHILLKPGLENFEHTREGQEYWSGEPIPSPVDLPDPGIQLGSPALQADSLLISYQGSPFHVMGTPN